MCYLWPCSKVVLQLLWTQVDVPGNVLPGTTREVIVWRVVCVTPYMAEKCGVVTGRKLAADVEGSLCGARRDCGVCKEPVRTNLASQIPPSIAMSILYMNIDWRPMRHPNLVAC